MPVDDYLKGNAIGQQIGQAAGQVVQQYRAKKAAKAEQEEYGRFLEEGALGVTKPDRLKEGAAEWRDLAQQRSQRQEFKGVTEKITQGQTGINEAMDAHGARMTDAERQELALGRTALQRSPEVSATRRPLVGAINEDGSPQEEIVVETPWGEVNMEKHAMLVRKEIAETTESHAYRMDLYNAALARYPNNTYVKEHIAALIGQENSKLQNFWKALEIQNGIETKRFEGSRDAALKRIEAQGRIDSQGGTQKEVDEARIAAETKRDTAKEALMKEREIAVAREKGALDLKVAQEKGSAADEALSSPYGIARSKEAAKKLQGTYEQATNLSFALEAMKALRTESNGGEILDRDAVSRGTALAADARTAVKELAKLGVLSKEDYKLIDEQIPPDPLAFDFIPGSDPIMAKIDAYSEMLEKKIETAKKTYLSDTRNPPAEQPQKTQTPGNFTLTKEDEDILGKYLQ